MLENLKDWKSTAIFFLISVAYSIAEGVMAVTGDVPIDWGRIVTVSVCITVLGMFSTFKSAYKAATPPRGPPGL